MACPRGYRGRHTGLYRDTEGKQPFSAYPHRRPGPEGLLRRPCSAGPDPPAHSGPGGQLTARRPEPRGCGSEEPGYARSKAGRPPRAQPARLGSFKG